MGKAWRTFWPLVCLVFVAEWPTVASGLNWFGEVKPEREWDYFERDRGKKELDAASHHYRDDRSVELPRS